MTATEAKSRARRDQNKSAVRKILEFLPVAELEARFLDSPTELLHAFLIVADEPEFEKYGWMKDKAKAELERRKDRRTMLALIFGAAGLLLSLASLAVAILRK